MSHNKQKKIAVINDFCGFGRCSIAVSLPIISAMKVQCCPLPTSIFSNHTGFDSFFYTDYTEHMDSYIEQWSRLGLRFDGILTGYLGSPLQIETVKHFLEQFKADGTVAIVDPVMGDNGRLYSAYSPELAKRMSTLLPYADILTPNLTEACILTGTEYKRDMTDGELYTICKKLCGMGPSRIVVSGLEQDGDLKNYIFEKGKQPTAVLEHRVGPCRAGTGDVFSSVITADIVNGVPLTDAVRHASAFIAKAMRRTLEMGIPETDGVCFEEILKEI